MKKNVGTLDRTLRFVIGLILILMVFIGPQTPWGWLGLILIGTAVISWCPIYAPLKISTIGKSNQESAPADKSE
jgi:phosphatidylglycerophosphate synthase